MGLSTALLLPHFLGMLQFFNSEVITIQLWLVVFPGVGNRGYSFISNSTFLLGACLLSGSLNQRPDSKFDRFLVHFISFNSHKYHTYYNILLI